MPNDKQKPARKTLDLGLSKKEWLAALAGQGAALADELTTEHNLHRGYGEGDPLARPLTELPEPAYIATGAALTAGLTAAAHKLKKSRHKILRAIGDVAQDVQIGVNAGNAIRNSQLPNRLDSTSGPTSPVHRPPPPGPPHAENSLEPQEPAIPILDHHDLRIDSVSDEEQAEMQPTAILDHHDLRIAPEKG